MDVQTDKMSEEQRDEQLKQRFKNLGDTDISILYFGLMQLKSGFDLMSFMYNFPDTYVEDAFVIARNRFENFICSYLDDDKFQDNINIKAIDYASEHLKNINFFDNKGNVDRSLEMLRNIRKEIIVEMSQEKK